MFSVSPAGASPQGRLCSRLFDKLGVADGTRDLNLSLSPGHAQFIFAFGAMIIAVIPIVELGGPAAEKALDPAPGGKKFLILRPALRRVAGKHAEKDQDEQNPGENGKQQKPRKGSQGPEDEILDQKKPVELIGAVAAVHEALHPLLKAHEKVIHFLPLDPFQDEIAEWTPRGRACRSPAPQRRTETGQIYPRPRSKWRKGLAPPPASG